LRWNNEWTADQRSDEAEGAKAAHRAVDLAPDDPSTLAAAAMAIAIMNGEAHSAIPWLDRAIALNPNSALALGRGATVRNFVGDYLTAAEHATRAMRLSPFDPRSSLFSQAMGVSHLCRRQLPEAIRWLQIGAQQNSKYPAIFNFLASALAHAGRLDEARKAMAQQIALRPTYSVARARARNMFKVAVDLEYITEGARMAGLPEE
jgi:tetratricopeptide (TPR) repeat protein